MTVGRHSSAKVLELRPSDGNETDSSCDRYPGRVFNVIDPAGSLKVNLTRGAVFTLLSDP